jgi:hypothetical protein
MLRDLPPTREKLAQGKPHHGPAVPGLLQLFRKLCSRLIQRWNVFILELDRHVDKSVLMLLVVAVPVVGMTVSAVLLVFVRMIVFRFHSDLSQIPLNGRVQKPNANEYYLPLRHTRESEYPVVF